MKKIAKILLLIVILGGGGYAAYVYVISPNLGAITTADESGVNVTDSADVINQKFVQSLAGISTITLDKSIFSNQAFSSLVDYSTPLIPEPTIGRPNPFLPIGTEEGAFVSTTTTAVENTSVTPKQ